MSLIIIGEAATKAMDNYDAFTETHPEGPRRSIRGMRNLKPSTKLHASIVACCIWSR